MSYLFYRLPFNFNIKGWNTSNVTDMSYMFADSNFNQDIEFNTEYVKNMEGMFEGASQFNSNINFTNTGYVTNMSKMFNNATEFNKPVIFNTSHVIDMSYMFCGSENFNQPIDFDTSHVINMSHMLTRCLRFNQPLDFDTSNVLDISFMFAYAKVFNQNISNWNLSKVEDYTNVFDGCDIQEENKPKFKS